MIMSYYSPHLREGQLRSLRGDMSMRCSNRQYFHDAFAADCLRFSLLLHQNATHVSSKAAADPGSAFNAEIQQ